MVIAGGGFDFFFAKHQVQIYAHCEVKGELLEERGEGRHFTRTMNDLAGSMGGYVVKRNSLFHPRNDLFHIKLFTPAFHPFFAFVIPPPPPRVQGDTAHKLNLVFVGACFLDRLFICHACPEDAVVIPLWF